MALGPSGTIRTAPSRPPGSSILATPPFPPPLMTPQKPNSKGSTQVGSIQSSPSTRNAVDAPAASSIAYFKVKPPSERPSQGSIATFPGGNQGAGVPGDGTGTGIPSIGDNSTDDAANRLDDLTTAQQGAASTASSTAEAEANKAAVEARRQGVLGCISRNAGGGGTTTPPCDEPCDTVDCLTELLTGNLLSLDAKAILCKTIRASERAAQRQVANIGGALLDAATSLADAEILQAPLRELDNAFGQLDPGAVAKCFGAQEVINSARGKLRSVNRAISDAEAGVQDSLAESFNEGIQKAQQFASLPEGFC